MDQNINLREAYPYEDSLVAEHFYQMWRDNNVPAHSIRSDWLDITLQFIEYARRELCYKAFVAEVDNIVVGSSGSQFLPPYL